MAAADVVDVDDVDEVGAVGDALDAANDSRDVDVDLVYFVHSRTTSASENRPYH